MSKEIRIFFGFAVLQILTGPDSRHFFNRSDAKLKPIATWSPAFSRTKGNLVAVTMSSHWLLKPMRAPFSFFMIGFCDCLGFDFMALRLIRRNATFDPNDDGLQHNREIVNTNGTANVLKHCCG